MENECQALHCPHSEQLECDYPRCCDITASGGITLPPLSELLKVKTDG